MHVVSSWDLPLSRLKPEVKLMPHHATYSFFLLLEPFFFERQVLFRPFLNPQNKNNIAFIPIGLVPTVMFMDDGN